MRVSSEAGCGWRHTAIENAVIITAMPTIAISVDVRCVTLQSSRCGQRIRVDGNAGFSVFRL